MKWRVPNELEPTRTTWDEMLVEMEWLRGNFKCDAERKDIFFRTVAKPCSDAAHHWFQRIHSRYGEGGSDRVDQVLRCGPNIPGSAKKDSLPERVRPPVDGGPAPLTETRIGIILSRARLRIVPGYAVLEGDPTTSKNIQCTSDG